jgi:two-component sensor histidine kinase
MKITAVVCSLVLLLTPLAWAQESITQLDVRKAVPMDAFMAVHGKYNPERDYQQKYAADVWQTVKDEQIIERILKIATSRMKVEDLANAEKVIDELRAAIDPVLTAENFKFEEVVYAQVFQMPQSYHLVVIRLPGDQAEMLEQSCHNLLAILEKYTEGKIPIVRLTHGDVEVTGLGLPPQAPSPTFARVGDVFLFSTSQALVSQAIENLQSDTTKSKFDDPRFAEAFANLPPAEDSMTIFDGEQLFTQMRGLGDFIRQQAKQDPQANRVAEIMELVADELGVFDYEVAVEYTEGNENRTAAIGKIEEGAEDRLVGKLALGGESFTDWEKWIPQDAVAYSLSKGVRLHAAYEHVMNILRTKFPETVPHLDQFEAMQQQVDFHFDRDILQSFSGESVSLSLPREDKGQDTVMALKCSNPERIRELLHRLVDNLQKIPALQSQQIKFTTVENLEGFETLEVATLAAFNVKPVIGFNDGWLMIGSNPECLQKVIDARAGKVPTIAGSDHFERFHLDIEGAVDSLSFTDLKASVRQVAQMIRQVGAIAPMFIAMAGGNAASEEMKPVMEALAILPSIAKVVEKFDYYEAKLAVVQTGPLPNTYLKQSVTLIRPE